MDWAALSTQIMTANIDEPTYQDDLHYERAVWPEKFSSADSNKYVILGERILLAIQGIDISLEEMAKRASAKDYELPDVGDGN